MSAQLEDGYTRTANEIIDFLMKTRLNGTQHSIIYCVIRNTYGFQRKCHELSLTYISTATGIHKDLIKREIDKLIEFKVIKVFKEAGFRTTREIGINKKTEDWKVHSEPKSRQSTKQSTVSELVSEQSPKQSTPTVDGLVYQERKSFKEINKATTRESHIQILNMYCYLHNKLELNISPIDRGKMMELAESGIPLEFVLENMKKVFEARGDNIRGFGYYSPIIKDSWKNKSTPIITEKRTSIPEWKKKINAQQRYENMEVARNRWISKGNDPDAFVYDPDTEY